MNFLFKKKPAGTFVFVRVLVGVKNMESIIDVQCIQQTSEPKVSLTLLNNYIIFFFIKNKYQTQIVL